MADRSPTTAPWDSHDDASRTLLGLIAQSANDGIWDWHLDTGQVFYSRRWFELIGQASGDISSDVNLFLDRLHDDDRARVNDGIADYLSGRASEYRIELRLKHDDGDWRWILSRGIALRDATGRALRFAGTHTDITERVRAAERLETEVSERTAELRAARDRAESSTVAKTKFLAAASHDIRQPLQAMALLLGSLAPEVQTEAGRRTMRAIERSLGAGIELLDAMLEFISLDAGAIRPRIGGVALGNLIETLVDTHLVEAAGKGLEVRVVSTTATARSDPRMLARMLRNLMSNALKYTDRGRVLIGCRRRAGRIWLEVWDTGTGIPPEQLRQIFWEFCQGDDLRQPGRGLGLGLAIVERLGHLLKHPVHVRSWPGRGSVFAIEMEAAAEAADTEEPSPPLGSDALLAGLRVALVEDDSAVAPSLAALLASWGGEVVAAPTCQALLKRLDGALPDLVIADWELADGEDGFAALARLDELSGRRLPSLVLTGSYDIDALKRHNTAHRRVLHKPVWPAVLQAVLRSELSENATAAIDHPLASPARWAAKSI